MNKINMCCLLMVVAVGHWGIAQTVNVEATGLLEKTGVKGGLCLVVGAKDTLAAKAFVEKSALYVQVLQADATVAAQWGAEFSSQSYSNRGRIGVRNSGFDADHYGSDLFNLIVVEDATALGKAKVADLYRILVPGGVLALRSVSGAFAAEAKALEIPVQMAGAYAAVYYKPVKPVEWKICDSIKWRAGPRAQLASGWTSIGEAEGKLYYREALEKQGTLETCDSQLFARDAYNGRLLWSLSEDKWRAPRPLAAANGKVFTTLNDKLVCLDAATGRTLFDIIPSGLNGQWSVHRLEIVGDCLLAKGQFGFCGFSTHDGKKIWEVGNVEKWISTKDKLITVTDRGRSIQARDPKDPKKILWTAKPEKLGSMFCSDHYLHINENQFVGATHNITTLSLDTGKAVWSYTGPTLEKKGRSCAYEYFGDKFYVMNYHPYASKTQDLWMTRLDINTGKVEADDCGPKGANNFNMCGPVFHKAGKYLVYFFSVWIDMTNNSTRFPYLAHPSCFFGTVFSDGMMFNFPSRKAGALQGISAMAPVDIKFDQEPGGKVLRKFADAKPSAVEAREDEWPTFRASPRRGNSVKVSVGEKPVKVWETAIGLGGKTFGVMSSERTGLTQPVSAGGLVVVSDLDAQRIVAVNAADGKVKWIFPVEGRVEFSPTLYKGLCLFAAKDGWIYCLNAGDGSLAWKLLLTPRERLIGGHDKLEALWPVVSDVMIVNGVGYACAGLSLDHFGGVRALAFRPESGEVVWSQTYYDEKHAGYGPGQGATMMVSDNSIKDPQIAMGNILIEPGSGKILRRGVELSGVLQYRNWGSIEDYIAAGVSIPRNGEDRAPAGMDDGRIWGKTIAFDKELSVAYANDGGPQEWAYKGKLRLYAKKVKGKDKLWENLDADMTVDDIVLTPTYVYCVGHYQRVKKGPELLVVSREDGKVVNAVPVDGFPSFCGMSAAGGQLYVSTREGKLICFKGGK